MAVNHARAESDDIELYRAARELIQQFGAFAPMNAAMRAQKMLADGDVVACKHWLRVKESAADLLREGGGALFGE